MKQGHWLPVNLCVTGAPRKCRPRLLVAGSTRRGNGEMLVAHVKRAATFSANFSAVTAESGIKSTLDILNFFL